jgi:hypothetical protein
VVQFESSLGRRAYLTRVKGFIGQEGATGGGLNQSYETMGYHAAIYWRFLYEKCGGMRPGVEDPAAGMRVIRTMLETLYTAEITDVAGNSNIVEGLPRLMDRVFEKEAACPFKDYADSLVQFARAVYAVKLVDGRCFKPGIPVECGFYDPNNLYPLPPVRSVDLASTAQPVSADIPSSYGIDFIDVRVGPDTDGRSLSIEFANASGAETIFSIQVLAIQILDDHTSQSAYMVPVTQYGQSAVLAEETGNESVVIDISSAELRNIDCIGLIVTRLDRNEKSEDGGYELRFHML